MDGHGNGEDIVRSPTRRRLAAIGSIAIVTGLLSAGSANADTEPAVLYGVVTNEASTAPLTGACVAVMSDETTEVASSCTNALGEYRITGIPGGKTYRVRTTTVDGIVRWHLAPYGAPYYTAVGSAVTLSAGMHKVAHIPTWTTAGTVSGRVVDHTGTPLANRTVGVTRLGKGFPAWALRTDADGRYTTAQLPPSRYRISAGGGAIGELDVTGGSAGTLDLIVPEPASLNVRLVDKATGTPLLDGCATVSGICLDTGEVRSFTGLTPGTTSITVPGSVTRFTTQQTVTLQSGVTTEVTVPVELAGALRLTVRSATDPAVHPRACTAMEDPRTAIYCTDANGVMTIGPVRDPKIRVALVPNAPFGAQWVGPAGGVGDPAEARLFELTPGQVTQGEAALDAATTVHGTVTDRFSGGPAGCVKIPLITGVNFHDITCGSGGQYTVNGVGPYRWALQAYGDGYLPEMFFGVAGGADDNVQLRPGARLEGSVGNIDGRDIQANVYVYDLAGNQLAMTSAYQSRQFSLTALPTSTVLLKVEWGITICWFGGPGIPIVAGETRWLDPLLIAPGCQATVTFPASAKAAS